MPYFYPLGRCCTWPTATWRRTRCARVTASTRCAARCSGCRCARSRLPRYVPDAAAGVPGAGCPGTSPMRPDACIVSLCSD
eukprot:365532-Chlamydomonas_euryale.AAC.9